MAIQILSDLHLESPKAYDTFEVVVSAPYLALLGDIGYAARHKDDLLAFLKAMLHRFRAVLFVPGNHEAYHSDWPEVLTILRNFQHQILEEQQQPRSAETPALGSFFLLDRGFFCPPDHPAVVVLGCSLFSAVETKDAMAVSHGLSDFYLTGAEWDVAAHNAAHVRDVEWLNEMVAELESKESVESIVVLTHWSPTQDSRAGDPRHAASPISSAFSTDLRREVCFTSPKVKIWAFGHTHYNCDFMLDRGYASAPLRLVTNQRGYYFQQSVGFDVAKKIELVDL